MANQEHLDILKQGVVVWNKWREEHPEIMPDLSRTGFVAGPLVMANFNGANLSHTNLSRAALLNDMFDVNFAGANLHNASFSGAHLNNVDFQEANLSDASFQGTTFNNILFKGANLSGSNLSGAYLTQIDFEGVNLSQADLTEACLYGATFADTDLTGADLRRAEISGAEIDNIDYNKLDSSDWDEGGIYHESANFSHSVLNGADLSKLNLSHVDFYGAILQNANLSESNLQYTNFCGADLSRANLTNAVMVETNLRSAKVSECLIYGISAWKIQLDHAEQLNMVITSSEETQITVDNLEVAQFIYLLLNNQKIRDVINTITSKVVLILGRFTEERKPVLDAVRDELRNYNYSPVMFDFDPSANRDLTETISTLAHMSRFIIADLTDAKSLPQELQAIVPNLPSVPVQPILHVDDREYAMFEHFKRYPWVLETYRYQDIPTVLASLKENIIEPVEKKAIELEGRR